MTKLYQRYIIVLYLKNFFIIFLALELFYVSVDFITNYKDLPESANLHILYIIFNFMVAVNYILPLSIIFAMITTKFNMIRSNEIISLYSVGINKNALIRPIFFTSLALIIIYYALNMSQFAYAQEFRNNILKHNQIGSISSDLFLKHNQKYIHFTKLDPYKQEAIGIKIFDLQENELSNIIFAKKGYFKKNVWSLEDVRIISKSKVIDQNATLHIEELRKLDVLKGFRPKIIENAHQGKSALSIPDAIDAIKFFKNQDVNINAFKANLYLILFFPLFAPLMVMILYYYLPVSGRFFNLALMSFAFICISLVSWGLLFVIGKFAANSVFSPEIGIILPIVLFALFAAYLYKKNA